VSIDSEVQLTKRLHQEIKEWMSAYEIPHPLNKDVIADLAGTITGLLKDSHVLPPYFPRTNDQDDEHYND